MCQRRHHQRTWGGVHKGNRTVSVPSAKGAKAGSFVQSIGEGVTVDDVEDMAELDHATNGRQNIERLAGD